MAALVETLPQLCPLFTGSVAQFTGTWWTQSRCCCCNQPDLLYWIYAERFVHKLDTFTDLHRTA